MEPDRQQVYSPITARAVCLGLFASIVINLVMPFNDWYLENTLLIGNHFPVISLVLILVLLLGGNYIAKQFLKTQGLSSGELLLVWGMIGVAGGIGSAGLMRYLPPFIVSPAYYANKSNDFDIYILKYIPEWMVVSKDPNSNAVKWFMEGLPQGEKIPWGMWITPMATWFAFALLLYCSNFAMVSFFFQQWSVRERLIFPVVYLPVELAREAPKGKILNALLRNPLTWVGVVIPCLIWGINGLRTYLPGIPAITMSWPTWGLFPDRPWSEFNMSSANLYFSVIGLTFLLTSEMAFSLWFIYFLYRLSYVFVDWVGSGGTGFWANWGTRVTVFEAGGAMFVIAGFLFWTARKFLKDWWKRVLAGKRDPELDPLSPRMTFVLMIAGLAGMTAWFILAGAAPWAAVFSVITFLVVLLVLTRIVAEAGLIFVQSNVIPYDMLTGMFPPAWLTGATLTSTVMAKGVMMFDLREIFMPYVMNGVRAAEQARLKLGKVIGILMLTTVIAVGVSSYSKISTCYKYGASGMDDAASIWFPTGFLGNAASFQKNPPTFNFITVGETNVFPVNAAHFVLGGIISAGMLIMRAKFLWWPLHPFGLVLCGTWAMDMFWLSIFLGWAAKVSFMTFGGAAVYRKALPFFLGLVIGETVVAGLWIVLGLITGVPGTPILPY